MIQIGINIAVKGIGSSLIAYLVNNFKTRIIADGGIFEAESCLVQSLNF